MLIELAKQAGADAVKFQAFKAEHIVSDEGFKGLQVGFQSNWKKPVVEVYKDAEFPRAWFSELFEYSKKQGLVFFSAPYDKEAVDIMDNLEIPLFKVGSGDITWHENLSYIASKGKPILLATGASTAKEVEEAVEVVRAARNSSLVLLQCVTNYPSHFEDANLLAMAEYRRRHGVLVGYSDHTPGYIVPLGAVALGACVIEKHFTDDKTRPGPDHPHAMDFEDFKLMVDNVRTLEVALGKPGKEVYPEEHETVVLQRRCIRATMELLEGTVLTQDMLTVLRPAPKDSIPPKHLLELIGKRLKRGLNKGEHFAWEMLN
jgi:sialic acid synthase SpsE